jgi:hypothetical protein
MIYNHHYYTPSIIIYIYITYIYTPHYSKHSSAPDSSGHPEAKEKIAEASGIRAGGMPGASERWGKYMT